MEEEIDERVLLDCEELRKLPRRKPVPEAQLPESTEPTAAEIDKLAENVLVVDTGVFCRHSYIISVVCLRIESVVERNAGAARQQ